MLGLLDRISKAFARHESTTPVTRAQSRPSSSSIGVFVNISSEDAGRMIVGFTTDELCDLIKRFIDAAEMEAPDVRQRHNDVFGEWYYETVEGGRVDMRPASSFVRTIAEWYRACSRVQDVHCEVDDEDSSVRCSIVVDMPVYDDELMEELVDTEMQAAALARKHGYVFCNQYLPSLHGVVADVSALPPRTEVD